MYRKYDSLDCLVLDMLNYGGVLMEKLKWPFKPHAAETVHIDSFKHVLHRMIYH